jgi:hypothetical protein
LRLFVLLLIAAGVKHYDNYWGTLKKFQVFKATRSGSQVFIVKADVHFDDGDVYLGTPLEELSSVSWELPHPNKMKAMVHLHDREIQEAPLGNEGSTHRPTSETETTSQATMLNATALPRAHDARGDIGALQHKISMLEAVIDLGDPEAEDLALLATLKEELQVLVVATSQKKACAAKPNYEELISAKKAELRRVVSGSASGDSKAIMEEIRNLVERQKNDGGTGVPGAASSTFRVDSAIVAGGATKRPFADVTLSSNNTSTSSAFGGFHNPIQAALALPQQKKIKTLGETKNEPGGARAESTSDGFGAVTKKATKSILSSNRVIAKHEGWLKEGMYHALYTKLINFFCKTPEEQVMKNLLLFGFNSLPMAVLIFTKISWGIYSEEEKKGTTKFLDKIVDIALQGISESDMELLSASGATCEDELKRFMLTVFGKVKDSMGGVPTINSFELAKIIGSGSDYRGLSQQISNFRNQIKVVIRDKLLRWIPSFSFPKESWYTRKRGEHEPVAIEEIAAFKALVIEYKLVEYFSAPIKSFGEAAWYSTLEDMLYKGGISDLRTIKFPGLSEREVRCKLHSTLKKEPRLVCYIVAFLLNIFTTACISWWSWRKQGDFSNHMVCHTKTFAEMEEAAGLVKADLDWWEVIADKSSVVAEVPWLNANKEVPTNDVPKSASVSGSGGRMKKVFANDESD